MSFFNAFRFLTIIPVPVKGPEKEDPIGHSLAYFPLVGLFIGLLLAGIDRSFSFILPHPVVTGFVIASLVTITGALHLDGFIDSMDGLFICGSSEKRLEVMKDSRAGSFGVAGAFLLLLIKYLSLENLPQSVQLFGLILMPALSRWCVVWPIIIFPSARPWGLGQSFKSRANWSRAIAATLFAMAIAIALFKLKGLIIMAGLWIISMLAALFINRRLSGLTGDSYGAIIEIGDLVSLLLVLIIAI